MAYRQFELDRELKMIDAQMKRESHAQAMQSGAFKAAQAQEAHQQKMAQSKSVE